MGLSAKVILPDEKGTEIIVKARHIGPDIYVVDGKIVHEDEWAHKGSYNRKIQLTVNGHDVIFEYSLDKDKDHTRVFVNGELYKVDIFNLNEALHGSPQIDAIGKVVRLISITVMLFLLLLFFY